MWEATNVVSVHKEGSRSDPVNYLLVSLLFMIRKVFEGITDSHQYLIFDRQQAVWLPEGAL